MGSKGRGDGPRQQVVLLGVGHVDVVGVDVVVAVVCGGVDDGWVLRVILVTVMMVVREFEVGHVLRDGRGPGADVGVVGRLEREGEVLGDRDGPFRVAAAVADDDRRRVVGERVVVGDNLVRSAIRRLVVERDGPPFAVEGLLREPEDDDDAGEPGQEADDGVGVEFGRFLAVAGEDGGQRGRGERAVLKEVDCGGDREGVVRWLVWWW